MWLMIAGAAVSAISAYQQGQAAKKAGEYNAAIAMQNTKMARDQAAARAKQTDRMNRLRLGSIRASQGASGGAQDEGSVLDVLGDAAVQGELERQNVLYQGEVEARGHENQAQLARMGAKSAGKAGIMSAGSALLGGASSAYGGMTRTA